MDTCNYYLYIISFSNSCLSTHEQCIMAVSDSRGNTHQRNKFEWTQQEDSTTRLHADFSDSNTIIFDSFSSEEEVKQRNITVNNISKINDPSRRFAADFSVRVTGKVTTVLSASTVSDYRVVDERRITQHNNNAALLMAKPIATFSSIIAAPHLPQANTEGGVSPIPSRQAIPSPSLTEVGESITSSPVVAQVSDSELIASLVAASAEPIQVNNELIASLTALSAVATHQSNTISLLTATPTRTDQLRKRCHGLLQQRSGSTNYQQQQNLVIAPCNNNNFIGANHNTRSAMPTPMKQFMHLTSPHTISPSVVPPPDSGSFFVSIPRPADVHQTLLLQATQVGRKRERDHRDNDGQSPSFDGIQQMDAHGNALNRSGSSIVEPDLRDLSYSFIDQNIVASTPAGIATSPVGYMADAFPGGDNALNLTAAKRSSLSSMHEELTPPPTGIRDFPVNAPTGAAIMSSAFTPLAGFYRRIIPPMVASDVDDVEYHPFQQQQQRVSSTDINFTSVAFCPMPDAAAARLNFSDIKFRRSSEEIIALYALSELSTKK